mmetsp:Transcript_103752/g.290562  ORF Transcript_103752/g.290562 Transcript_103752/m.290562 type:complete len:226 (-) Transcript_103752:669-1346(-)
MGAFVERSTSLQSSATSSLQRSEMPYFRRQSWLLASRSSATRSRQWRGKSGLVMLSCKHCVTRPWPGRTPRQKSRTALKHARSSNGFMTMSSASKLPCNNSSSLQSTDSLSRCFRRQRCTASCPFLSPHNVVTSFAQTSFVTASASHIKLCTCTMRITAFLHESLWSVLKFFFRQCTTWPPLPWKRYVPSFVWPPKSSTRVMLSTAAFSAAHIFSMLLSHCVLSL